MTTVQELANTINDLSATVGTLAQKLSDIDTNFNTLQDLYYRNNTIDRFIFDKDIQVTDTNIVLSVVNGTRIGTDTSQKLGFYGKTPVAQQGAITAPLGGATVDTQARTAINAIITALQTLGITA